VVFAIKLVEVKLGEGDMAKQFSHLFKTTSIVEGSLSPEFLHGKLKPT